jgi:RNA polymerase sigma factor (sigma-70 family)
MNRGIRLQQDNARTAPLAAVPPQFESVRAFAESDLADKDMVGRLLSTLEPREREVIRLRHFAGFSSQETAQAVGGMNDDNVNTIYHRALAKMRKQAEKLGEKR